MNELERLLELATLEPANGPMFYRALLSEPVYVLMPTGAMFTERGTVRFIMWTGEDGQRVIPFFSSSAAIRRIITPQAQSVRLKSGRVFLEACRGGIVVLNPNLEYTCRLTAEEIALLLDTGSPNAPKKCVALEEMTIEPHQPDVPADLLNSLSLLLSQIPGVDRAYVVTIHPTDDASAKAWLLAMVAESDATAQLAAEQISAMLVDCAPTMSVDLLGMKPGSANAVAMGGQLLPFYDRALGERVVMNADSATQ